VYVSHIQHVTEKVFLLHSTQVLCQYRLEEQIMLILRILKHSVRTSQETHYVTATKPNRLMLFRETVAVYCENHTEHTNTLCEQNVEFCYVKDGGTYNNHLALRINFFA
jgi:hypothetical protein